MCSPYYIIVSFLSSMGIKDQIAMVTENRCSKRNVQHFNLWRVTTKALSQSYCPVVLFTFLPNSLREIGNNLLEANTYQE